MHTFSMPMAFMTRTTPSKAVFRISGAVCSTNVLLNTAEENSLPVTQPVIEALPLDAE